MRDFSTLINSARRKRNYSITVLLKATYRAAQIVRTLSILFIQNHALLISVIQKKHEKLCKVSNKLLNVSTMRFQRTFHESFLWLRLWHNVLIISSTCWILADVRHLRVCLIPYFLSQISSLSVCLSNLEILATHQCLLRISFHNRLAPHYRNHTMSSVSSTAIIMKLWCYKTKIQTLSYHWTNELWDT